MAKKSTAQPEDITETLEPMEARLAKELPRGTGWQFEPKWDGFRCLAFRWPMGAAGSGERIELRAKSGKSLSRFFPEVLQRLQAVPHDRFVLDGELVIPVGPALSFDALQMRLHPAQSRIQRLARETPATLIAFDCLLGIDGTNLLNEPLSVRRNALEQLFGADGDPIAPGLLLSPYTRKHAEAQKWLDRAQGALDGVVADRMGGDAADRAARSAGDPRLLAAPDAGGGRFANRPAGVKIGMKKPRLGEPSGEKVIGG